MDGVRARRMKNGSPVGRIVDEALDTLQQACYALWLGYVFRFDNLLFELMFLMPNLIFYTMEMKYVICKNLKMIVGEIGPVEIELLMASICISAGYFGVDGL
jgi:phosphatidylglycerophosphate synthase